MKYMRLFEDFNPIYIFQDKDLIVHKIKHDKNKGKIFFKFGNDKYKNNAYFSKLSEILGCAKILDTKYENELSIRNAIIEKKSKVQTVTVDAILNKFNSTRKVANKDDRNKFKSSIKNTIRSKFIPEIQSLMDSAINLGDIMDGLKKIREEYYKFFDEKYDDWRFDIDTKIFNVL